VRSSVAGLDAIARWVTTADHDEGRVTSWSPALVRSVSDYLWIRPDSPAVVPFAYPAFVARTVTVSRSPTSFDVVV
jgi:hypothetical protein